MIPPLFTKSLQCSLKIFAKSCHILPLKRIYSVEDIPRKLSIGGVHMSNLSVIEKHLYSFLSTGVIRCFKRTVTDNCIILTSRSPCTLSVYIFSDLICVNYADECDEFDIGTSKAQSTLETAGRFINELMTGAVICERVYYGHVQTSYRMTLVNKITRRKISLRDVVVNTDYSPDEPRLVIREKLFFS